METFTAKEIGKSLRANSISNYGFYDFLLHIITRAYDGKLPNPVPEKYDIELTINGQKSSIKDFFEQVEKSFDEAVNEKFDDEIKEKLFNMGDRFDDLLDDFERKMREELNIPKAEC